MKNQRGITLTSLIIYLILIFIIIVILARVSTYFTSNMNEISKESTAVSEIDKFNMFFLKDTKGTNNGIESVSTDGTSITFKNGTTYSFSKEKQVIYYDNEEDDKKIIIAETIENCKFTISDQKGKEIITVEITINAKTYKNEYVMGHENVYKTYQVENNYTNVEESAGFAITTNTEGIIFTKSDGVTPADPYNLTNGDILIYEDYKYTYNGKTWSLSVTDKSKEEYGEIAVAAFGKPITSLYGTFKNCTNLIKTPQIPNTVTYLNQTFYGCSNLEFSPDLPDMATNVNDLFYGCSSLVIPPEMPEGITNMNNAFRGCTSLKTAPKIPETVTIMTYTFYNCSSLQEAPEIPNGVTNMTYTFRGCSSLEKTPVIPASVTNMNSTFYNCYKLQGEIIINASPTTYTTCFQNTGRDGTGIVLKGSSTVLNELAATNTNGKVTVGE